MAAEKDARVVVRLSSDLRNWIEAESSRRGLDMAAFVRMTMIQVRDGAMDQPFQRVPIMPRPTTAPFQPAPDTDDPTAEFDPGALIDAIVSDAASKIPVAPTGSPLDQVEAVGDRRQRSPRDWARR